MANLIPNETLRLLMKEFGYTREGLAEAVNVTVERLTGQPGHCTPRLVHYWLTGKVGCPRSHTRLALEELFGRPAHEIGFRPPEGRETSGTVRFIPPPAPQEPPVIRRKFVVGFGILFALPVLPEVGRLGMSDIERIRETETHLLQLDAQHGSKQLADVAARCIAHVEQAMRQCTYGGRVQTQLHRTLGDMCAVAGWLCYDSGRHDQARNWWDTALRYALLSRDTTLQARVWSYMARQAVDLGHASEAVSIARAALDATRGRREPHLTALLHARVALGHAAAGERSLSGRALARAEAETTTSPTRTPWLQFVGPGEITAQASLCHSRLGDHQRSLELRRQAVTLRGEGFQRNSFGDQVLLAECLLNAGDLEEAVTAGKEALAFLPAVSTPRWSARLRDFRDDVLDLGAPGAAEFADHYRKAMT
jgi:tetratricopeptide (TPR) repeat protein